MSASLAALLWVSGCATQELATPVPTPVPWPTAFANNVCNALVQLGIAADDVGSLRTAADEGDPDAAAHHAASALGMMDHAAESLEAAPRWPPGETVLRDFRTLTEDYRLALRGIGEALEAGDEEALEAGWELILRAEASAESVRAELDALARTTGFRC